MALLPYSDPETVVLTTYLLPYSDPQTVSTVPPQEEWLLPDGAGNLVPATMTGPKV